MVPSLDRGFSRQGRALLDYPSIDGFNTFLLVRQLGQLAWCWFFWGLVPMNCFMAITIWRGNQQAESLLLKAILQAPKRFQPDRVIKGLAHYHITAITIWRSWFLMKASPRRWAPTGAGWC
jgi:hypothetical protein